jgi:hypothetical protein
VVVVVVAVGEGEVAEVDSSHLKQVVGEVGKVPEVGEVDSSHLAKEMGR